jgi:hypothetical protein
VKVPGDTPVTTPDDDPVLPILELELLHVPPGVVFVSVAEKPGHILPVPEIAAGVMLTVAPLVATHPPGKV